LETATSFMDSPPLIVGISPNFCWRIFLQQLESNS
jgi:hypothetical protein